MQTTFKNETDSLGPLTLDEFPPHSYEDWKLAAEKLLKGAPFAKRLVAKTYEGFDLQPIYRREDLENLKHLGTDTAPGTTHRGNRADSYKNHPWKVAQELQETDPSRFNHKVREDIEKGVTETVCVIGGAQGLRVKSLQDLETALYQVDLKTHSLSLEPEADGHALADLAIDFLKCDSIDQTVLKGSLGLDPCGELARKGKLPCSKSEYFDRLAALTWQTKESCPELHTITASGRPYANGGCSSSQEIGYALATAVQYIRELAKRDLDLSSITSHLRFSLSIGPHFFMEIAKFRALRLLWAQAIAHMGGDISAQKLYLHTRTGQTNKTLYDSQVNILRTCTEGLSAILGGCDSLTIAPYDELKGKPSELARRIARNMHGILAEECSFNRVIDPGGGSYFLEHLTDKIAEEAWRVFQSIEEAGGMRHALKAGIPQAAIQATVARKKKDVAIGRSKLVGTNCFPNPQETLNAGDEAETATAQVSSTKQVAPTPPYRLAKEYERLRKGCERLKASRGYSPRVLQINLGPSRRYRLRADWTSSFFEVGGFEVLNDKDFADIASVIEEISQVQPDFAILTSDDATYASEGAALANRAKEAYPELRLFLAGAPGENEATLREAGMDEFIHIRTNNYEMLESLLKEVGALA